MLSSLTRNVYRGGVTSNACVFGARAFAAAAARKTGILDTWIPHKGVGFIKPEGAQSREENVFVHFSQIKGGESRPAREGKVGGFIRPAKGAAVEFELGMREGATKEVNEALNVTAPGGGDLEAHQPKAKE